MKFLIDAQLPPALARWVQEQGYDVQHVKILGLGDAEDHVIWTQAMTQAITIDAIIITKDEDFAARAAREATAPVIVWLRIGNATNHVLIQWLEPRWTQIVSLLNDGHQLIEAR